MKYIYGMLVTQRRQRELLILLFPNFHFLGCVRSSSRLPRCPRIRVPFHFLGNKKVVHSQNYGLFKNHIHDLNSFTFNTVLGNLFFTKTDDEIILF